MSTVDIFENEIGLARRRNSGIDKLRNVRMRKPAQNTPLTFESCLTASAHQCYVQELNCYLAFETSIAALREPHASHTALPDRRQKRVRIDGFARTCRRAGRKRWPLLKEPFLRQRLVLLEKGLKLVRKSRIQCAQGRQPAGTRFFRHGKRFIEIRRNRLPPICAECGHLVFSAR